MGKIKILHIIKSLGRGGAEMLLPETLLLHDLQNFEFHYIYFLPWKNQMVDEIEKAGGKVKCFPAKNNVQLLLRVNEVSKYCITHQIDLIHAHLPWSGFLSRLVHVKNNIPVIYTEHNIQEKYHFVTRSLNKWSFNWQNIALGVSNDVTNSIQKNIKVKIPVRTLFNGVNTHKFSVNESAGDIIKRTYSIPEDAIVIGNLAVFREQKDLITWLKAFQRIKSLNPKVFGLLVGAGPEENIIKEFIKQEEIQDLILPGLQKNTIPYFSAFDIFMMSSKFEGLPIALLEAMSMECAIVSTKAGGVAEVVQNEDNGFLVEIEDHKSLASRSTTLINSPALLRHYKMKARERVLSKFSLTKMVKNIEKEYRQLLEVSNS
ncbi:glycosyltransferase [Gramella sp. KN1008]|uniref:glycosyltransferase n=1 Tax=Gramella sp. KN1008 TaxID=2529298 RepID=UPI00103DAEB6|nr:glycosyltransferase [Gramella sp. KN1008]TBW25596.1 glycosyltransferase [Gramella sp. KN1008]